MSLKDIEIRGACENNLKNININIPKGCIVVITGRSGSGKSSLAFDTIYKEGRRRYMENLSPFARQILGKIEKPKVSSIKGLSPTITIKESGGTIGTATEINDYIKLLYEKIGKITCPCGGDVIKYTLDQIVSEVMKLYKIKIIAPVKMGIREIERLGYVRVYVDGVEYLVSEIEDEVTGKIEIIVDRLIVREGSRLVDSIEQALKLSDGKVIIECPERLYFSTEGICKNCGNTNPDTESKIKGKTVSEVINLPLDELNDFLNIDLTENQKKVADEIISEIKRRLEFLLEMDIKLPLSRSLSTLSTGEKQRVNIGRLGDLSGVTYVLDEPARGLDTENVKRLVGVLHKLCKLGNSLIIVEHNLEVIKNADFIIDMCDGNITKSGKFDIFKDFNFISPTLPKKVAKEFLSFNKIYKNISINIPIGVLTVITGPSGSGKTTLLKKLSDEIEGSVLVTKASMLGMRSNVATYTGIYDYIRELFAKTKESRARGYTKSRFSFNVKSGRCEACKGIGFVKVDMNFLPDVSVPCEVCKGRRFNSETLNITYKGKSIFDVLNMQVDEALVFFKNFSIIREKLEFLRKLGLSYLHLGDSSLSRGEIQRVKLAGVLDRKVLLLDNPTMGLHFDDVYNLIKVFKGLETVIVAEHNTETIKAADYIIELK